MYRGLLMLMWSWMTHCLRFSAPYGYICYASHINSTSNHLHTRNLMDWPSFCCHLLLSASSVVQFEVRRRIASRLSVPEEQADSTAEGGDVHTLLQFPLSSHRKGFTEKQCA